MVNILAHRGYWNGVIADQNSKKAIKKALQLGYGLELDLRLGFDKDNNCINIFLSHDSLKGRDITSFQKLEDIILEFGDNLFLQPIAFHIKEEPGVMLPILNRLLKNENCFFFGIKKDYDKENYASMFGWKRVAYEYEHGREGSINEALNGAHGVVWCVDFVGNLNTEFFVKCRGHQKDVYFVSSEIVNKQNRFLEIPKILTGICTDMPDYYKLSQNFYKPTTLFKNYETKI